VEGLNEAALLFIIQTLFRKVQRVMMSFSFKHILVVEVMREL
jgi:hypothetical protein